MIKFNMYNICDTQTGVKARVSYHLAEGGDGIMRAWVCEKDYARNLLKIFKEAKNDSDGMTDYFESSKITFLENSPHYKTIAKIVEKLQAKRGG